MGITRTFHDPFYTGTAAAVSASGATKFDVVLNGVGYMIDLNNPEAHPFKLETIPMLKTMFLQDRGTIPIGEHSLNPQDYWRRSVDDWSAGAGQIFLDHDNSVGAQYRASKGIDPWTEGQIGMLADTSHQQTTSSTNLNLAVAGGYLYYLAGTTLTYTQDILTGSPSFTTVTGTTIVGATDLATDGYTVFVTDSNRVYYTTRGGATRAAYHTADHVATIIEVAKGRLFTANGRTLYTHSGASGSAVASVYFQHPNTDWTWTAIAAGLDSVYFAGYSGTTSMIYAATIKPDGTALDVPVVVATLPIGELARAMKAYFSVLMIGTDKGFRAAAVGGTAGQLSLGSLVAMTNPPSCFEDQDRFVWFGWTNYDSTSTGLGRIDLSRFNGDVPAYASDLMATTQGAVSAVVTFQSVRVFTVQGHGIYAQSTNKVTTATINSGWLNFALADSKLAIKFSIQYRIGAGSFQVSLSADDRTAVNVGNSVTTSILAGNSTTIQLPELQGRNFETTLTLNRSSSDHTAGPVVDRHTLMVEPQPERRAIWTVPFLLHSRVLDRSKMERHYEPSVERRRFMNLLQSREIIPFQDVEETYSVIVDDFLWVPFGLIGLSHKSWDGTLLAQLKVIN